MTQTTALTKREIQHLIIRDPKIAAQALAQFSPLERVGIIADACDQITAQEGGTKIAELTAGRAIEKTLDEFKSPNDYIETLQALAERGETDIILDMIRSNAGDLSSTAERVTPEILVQAIINDPFMDWPEEDGKPIPVEDIDPENFDCDEINRLTELLFTIIVMATDKGNYVSIPIAKFVLFYGKNFFKILKPFVDGDDSTAEENAQEIIRVAKQITREFKDQIEEQEAPETQPELETTKEIDLDL